MASQCLVPGDRLKSKLVSHLTNACSFSRIIKFFDLLISGQRLIDQTKNTFSEDPDLMSELLRKSSAILEKIKDVLANVSAEVLIQKLSGALETEIKTEDIMNLESFLLKMNNYEPSITSLEYLESLITFFDRLNRLYFNSELYCIHFGAYKVPVKDFRELNQLLYCAARESAMSILIVSLKINISSVEVTSEEKSKLQFLLLEAADVIKQYVEWDVSYQLLSLRYILRFRSCVQSILDLLVDCPAECGILLKELDKINDCKEIYDNLMRRDCILPLTDDSDSEDDSGIMVAGELKVIDGEEIYTEVSRKSLDEDFISKLPPSHTWWQLLK